MLSAMTKRPFYGNQYVTKERADKLRALNDIKATYGPTNRQLAKKRK